jgi:4-amino-4-deoxy-L-arabinose transferase-like glycosyltransferase
MSQKFYLLILAVITLIGIIVVLTATNWGIGASPDSVVYIGGARSIILNMGFSMITVGGGAEPITHHAPFYPLLLASTVSMNIDPVIGARWINALLFGLNILVVGIILRSVSIENEVDIYWISIVGSLFMLAAPIMLEIHVMAWTEPLFLFLGFSGLVLLAIYLQNSSRGYLILSGLMISLAFLTRYAGIALILSGVVGILLISSTSIKDRIKAAVFFTVVSSLPGTLWILRNMQTGGTATSRELSFHPIGTAQIGSAVTTISSWILVPTSAPIWIKLGAILSLIALFIYLFVKARRISSIGDMSIGLVNIPAIIKLLAVFCVVYVSFLVFSISFFDANTPLDSRILSPLYVSGLLIIMYLVRESLPQFAQVPAFRVPFALFGFFVLASYLWNSSTLILDGYQNGIGFNSLAWNSSAILDEVEKLPEDITIYTNAPEAIYFHFNRPAASIPRKVVSTTQQVNQNYLSDLAEMRDLVEQGRGVVLYFTALNRPTLLTEDELEQHLSLQVLTQAADGTIYTTANEN